MINNNDGRCDESFISLVLGYTTPQLVDRKIEEIQQDSAEKLQMVKKQLQESKAKCKEQDDVLGKLYPPRPVNL